MNHPIFDAQLLEDLTPFLPTHLTHTLSASEDINSEILATIAIHLTSLRYTLSTYLPDYLLDLIRSDPVPGRVAGGFHYGTAIFADVSGFTAMSEKLSTLGKEGAEEVTRVVNNYFGTMLAIAAQYRGDVLKFGGDALLLFFEGEDGPQRALATGQAMQEAMVNFAQVKTSLGNFPLRMSIGAGTGAVFLANLGSSAAMEYTAMGYTLTNMAQAEETAVAGQVVVDQATYEALGDGAQFTAIGDSFWLLEALNINVEPVAALEAEPETEPVMSLMLKDDIAGLLNRCRSHLQVLACLRPFIPAELLAQVIVDPPQEMLPGSHRPVTVMFANFYGIDEIIETLGPPHEAAVTEILNTYFVAMSDILNRYAGVVNKVDPYALGHRIMAMFGALRAREDDTQRAVRAALEMNDALTTVNKQVSQILSTIPDLETDFGPTPLKQRIGLNTGFVFAGNVGASTRREYSVMGDEVNLTARLMSVAEEGQLLVSQRVQQQAGSEFVFEEKEPVKVKGKTEPVRNYVVTGEREQTSRWANLTSSPIVGRAEELMQGQQVVDNVKQGRGQVLVISGVSGIGKTRLAEEVAYYGYRQGMDLLAGTCLSYGQTITYHPWTEIMRTYFGLQPNDPLDASAAKIATILAELGEADWTPVVGELLRLGIADNELTGSLEAKLRRQRLLDLTLKLLQTRAQNNPLILVIEDAHWADPASIDLVKYINRNIQNYPILVLIVHRPDEALLSWTGDQEATVSLSIGDLPDETAIDIVQNMIGPIDLPPALREIILTKGDGNPFFIEEVVRALIGAGAVEKRGAGNWQVVQTTESVELPGTIHGIIISRIDRLLETDRRLLQVASVVGAIFATDVIAGIYPYGDYRGSIRDHLSHLDQIGLTEDEPSDDRLHRFKHLTTHEVVYESQSFDQRRDLHCRIARFIEKTAQNAAEPIDLLAYHYFDGQDWGKAIYYNLQAARRAQREFANDTAVTAYKRVLEATARLDEETQVEELIAHESLGEVYTLLGRYDEALTHFETTRQLAATEPESMDQARHLAELSRKTADVYEKRSEYETAFAFLDQGLNYLNEAEPTLEAARIYLLGAGVYIRQGKIDDAIRWCQKGLDTAMQLQTREGIQAVAQAYYNLGYCYTRRGEFERTIKLCQTSEEVYRSIDDIVGQSQALINLANAYSDQGDWESADQALRKSLAMKQKIGDILYQGIISNNLGNINLYRGEWSEATRLFSESTKIWHQVGATAFEAITLSNLAQVHIYQENWIDARRCLSRSEAIFKEVGSEELLPELERRWGELHLKTGDLAQAETHTRRSITLAVNLKARLEEGMSYRILGQIEAAQGEVDSAFKTLDKSIAILADLDSDYETTKSRLAKIALWAGQPDPPADLDSQLTQVVAAFERLGAQADLAGATSLQARMTVPSGRD